MTNQKACQITDLVHADEAVREKAKKHLLSTPHGIAALADAVRGADAKLSYAAVKVLASFDDSQRFQLMADGLHAANPMTGSVAAKTLEIYGEEAVETLLDALPECHTLVQPTVVAALGRIGSPRAVAPLIKLMQSTEYTSLKYGIIEALGTIGDPVSIEVIHQMLDDANHHVRERAEIALARIEQGA